MTDDDVRALAQVHIAKAGSMDAWCKQVQLSRAYVHRQVKGVDPLGSKMLKALGLQVTQVTYGERS